MVDIDDAGTLAHGRVERPRVVVIIPAYNEEMAIARVVKGASIVLRDIAHDPEILVVDDDSHDQTRQILDKLDVQRFYHRRNLGKGDVIRNVLEFLAPDEIVVTMDGDGEHDPRDLPRLVEPVARGQADITIGSRFLHDDAGYLGRAKKGKHVKNMGNKLFSLLLWIFTRKSIKDTQSGFRAFKAGTVKRLHLGSDGFRIEMEMTVKALRRGYRVAEVAIGNRQGQRRSHLRVFPDGAKIAMTVLRESLPKGAKRPMDWLLPRLPKRLGRII
ncbi:MAG: glycosyltransferase family 2 protein, partial [Candidatus Lokiarchaeota archaeon]|nr:glycosyltransferase family 2 protein [Candidatus Lokiarchaeota archaeon]